MARKKSNKLCECGCGQYVSIAPETDRQLGHVRGQPVRFIRGHQSATHRHSSGRRGKSQRQSPTYRCWASMKTRCLNPNNAAYHYYGGRGITICDHWLHFDNFLSDMGEQPKGMTLDRIDNDGNYEPTNCRWASRRDQAFNRRSARLVTAFGETKTLTEWIEDDRCVVKKSALEGRLNRNWPIEKAIITPAFRHGARP